MERKVKDVYIFLSLLFVVPKVVCRFLLLF